MNDDIYAAFANAAEENYQSRKSQNQQSSSSGSQLYSLGGSTRATSKSSTHEENTLADSDEVPQIKIKKSGKEEEKKFAVPRREQEEEEKKGPSNGFQYPSINLERQSLNGLRDRFFNQGTGQAILDNAQSASLSVQERLRDPINFVSSKVTVSRQTQRRTMIAGYVASAFFLLFAV